MKTYAALQEQLEYNQYLTALNILEEYDAGLILEGVLDRLTGAIKQKVDFIKNVAEVSKKKLSDVIALFKDSRVFKFFKMIGFSFVKLFSILKDGYKAFIKVKHAIAEYLASTKVVKWTEDQLKKLDEFLNKHPIVKKLAGPAVSAILIYIWLNMAYSGDLASDMDFTDIIAALAGKFTLSELFAGPEGVKLLTLFFIGLAGNSFPWPSSQSAHIVGGVIWSLARMTKKKLSPA